MTPRALPLLLLLGTALLAAPAPGATYHVDPAGGQPDGDGSEGRPWRTLAEVAARGILTRLVDGDLVLLHDGDHGLVRFSGHHEGVVTIAAAPEARPRLSRLVLNDGEGWHLRGLTVSRELAPEPYSGSMVSIGDGGPSSRIVLEDSFVHGTLDSSGWSVEDWLAAPSGIWLGRHGKGLVVRNCHVLNTRFGIDLCAEDSICEGNVVSNFSGDGIRITRDGITVQFNVVKNAYCSGADGDPNHDDAIQCFLFNVGHGTVRRVTVRGNIIVGREDDGQPWPSSMQAIGFFDGPLVDFVVEGNVVLVSHWHGVTLCDAQGCRIEGNVCYSRWSGERPRPWIQLGQKQGLARGNVVRHNLAHTFDLAADAEVQAEDNRRVTERAFRTAFRRLAGQIAERHGPRCPVSDLPRLASGRRR